MSDLDSKEIPTVPDALSKPDVIGIPAPSERFAQARAAAIEAGLKIAQEFDHLDRHERIRLVTVFRVQLIPRKTSGRQRSRTITAAHADWKSGLTGLALYRKHILGFENMSRWKRESKARNLRDAIRSRERRAKK